VAPHQVEMLRDAPPADAIFSDDQRVDRRRRINAACDRVKTPASWRVIHCPAGEVVILIASI
jgi:hypothetical protein